MLKEVAKHLHLCVAKHRKQIHGKKKHDFNFRHKVVKVTKNSAYIVVFKWMQDQKAYSGRADVLYFHSNALASFGYS
jgi:hypothetical protein